MRRRTRRRRADGRGGDPPSGARRARTSPAPRRSPPDRTSSRSRAADPCWSSRTRRGSCRSRASSARRSGARVDRIGRPTCRGSCSPGRRRDRATRRSRTRPRRSRRSSCGMRSFGSSSRTPSAGWPPSGFAGRACARRARGYVPSLLRSTSASSRRELRRRERASVVDLVSLDVRVLREHEVARCGSARCSPR